MNNDGCSILVPDQKAGLQSQSGAALLLTMILMLLFSLLTLGLYELLQTSTQITGNHRLDLRTSYVADAGAEAAINELRNDPEWGGFGPTPFGGGTYEVVVSYDDSGTPPIVTIESTGTISGFQRKLIVEIEITGL